MSQNTKKLEKEINASSANRLLVICVDRDNDIGEKTGIPTRPASAWVNEMIPPLAAV